MGCPDAILAHLAGLQDVKEISFDIRKRVFTAVVNDDYDKEKLQKEIDIVSIKEGRTFTLESYEEIF
ncbi:hypothetical protein FHQ18_06905 [Deferribacter autotrophicus]|uniref:Heavy-metal-associated domain-containing protein n=1 Tax=Deferribacter autotrophicus TaxID=500465 RepID=A0A5A8F3T0_9BACT|nr:hypothetical protein [Deferribacter autotrophicus]KAA0258121.1 hypothetical protein FHQ18_06905 [Deferribacter autotrophicus]